MFPSLTPGGRARLFALLGAGAIAFSSIFVRLSHASPSTAAIFRCVDALPFLGLLAWREDRRLGPRGWRQHRPGLIAGVFFAADLIMWNHSIADVGAGLATVLANVQVVLLPLVAWLLLSERPARRVLQVIPVAALGVLLISGVLEQGAYGRDPTRGTLFGLGAGISYVGFLMLLRRGGSDLRHRPRPRARHPASLDARRPVHPVAGPLCDAVLVGAVLSVLEGLVVGDAHLIPVWPSAGWLAALAINSQVVGWLLIASSLPRLPTSTGSILLLAQPIGSVLLAALIFSESPTPLQLAGVVLVLSALVAVGLSRGGPPDPEPSPHASDAADSADGVGQVSRTDEPASLARRAVARS